MTDVLLLGAWMLFQIGAALGLTAWLAFGHHASFVHYLAHAAGIGAFVVFLFLANRWDLVGYWSRYAILAAFLTGAVIGGLRSWNEQPLLRTAAASDVVQLVVSLVAGVVFITLALQTIRGLTNRAYAVDLAFPLREIDWYVGQGGSSPWLNIHHGAGAQSFALDIVALGTFGYRATGVLPKRLGAYAIFDQPVYAPCSGRVVSLADGHPDQTPPTRDETNLAGNFVAIACDNFDVTVLVAHLRKGSVLPEIHASVAAGQHVANVGNSGNTTEPHLHIHAVRGIEPDIKRLTRDAQPVPITFSGRFLVRNDKGDLSRSRGHLTSPP